MSVDSQWRIQTLVYDVLANDNDLTGLLSDGVDSVYDHVPTNALYPYCALSQMRAAPMNTQVNRGMTVQLSIETFSKAMGYKELKSIMSRIHDLVDHADLMDPDFDLISVRFLSSDIESRSGGEIRRGRQVFEFITEPKS